jgi:predicted TIM-barrel fold metal-dependent hydrolase
VPDSDEDSLLRRMDRLDIRVAVIVSLRAVFSDAITGNEELARLVARHPDRLTGTATIDPRRATSPRDALQRARDDGLKGLALFPAHHNYTLGKEPMVEEALEHAADLNWPAVIPHRLIMCWWLPETPVESIVHAAERHPRVNIVLASANYGELAAVARASIGLDNLYVDISGAQSLDAVPELVKHGNPKRLLFGTGQPLQMPECNLIKLANDRIEQHIKDDILRTNAQRLFKL